MKSSLRVKSVGYNLNVLHSYHVCAYIILQTIFHAWDAYKYVHYLCPCQISRAQLQWFINHGHQTEI
jgi:hypothetical protein